MTGGKYTPEELEKLLYLLCGDPRDAGHEVGSINLSVNAVKALQRVVVDYRRTRALAGEVLTILEGTTIRQEPHVSAVIKLLKAEIGDGT